MLTKRVGIITRSNVLTAHRRRLQEMERADASIRLPLGVKSALPTAARQNK